MGKRKLDAIERRQKKMRNESDKILEGGVFTKHHTQERHIDDYEDTEHDYERAPRRLNIQTGIDALPIKKGGKVERVVRESVVEAESEGDSEDEAPVEQVETQVTQEEDDPDKNLTPAERLQKVKIEVASLASALMEDPEENIESLSKLRRLTESSNAATVQLSLLALVPVFKSLAPGYQIRALTDAEKREKISKDVARLRRYEQNLVVNYREYVLLLTRLAKVSVSNSQNTDKVTPQAIRLGELATRAACELCLSSLRHFNYREELFTIPIRRLNRKPTADSDLEVFTQCVRTLETLLKDDMDHGSITVEVTRIMCKVIKDKQFRVDEAVINIFLSLSLLDDYDPNNNKDDQPRPKLKKKNRVHLSKKQKKMRKELKEIDEEMRKAEMAVTAQERERSQAQILKLVLTLYLEILKAGSVETEDSAPAKRLTASVMEGLSRFGQMSNFDLLGDFLVVLKETMVNIVEERTLQRNKYGIKDDEDDETGGIYTAQDIRKLLLCVTAAFTLVLNHGEVGRLPISFDLVAFVSTLYQVLGDASISPDLEFSHKSLRLADPLGMSNFAEKPAVNVSTNAELLLKSLDSVFFRSRNGSVARAMPFTKRLYLASLHTPEKTSIALLKFVAKLVNKYGDGLKGLWSTEENISGEGNYVLGYEKPDIEVDLERCNVGSAVLWENVLLDKHYCAVIKDGSRSLMKNSKDSDSKR